MTDVTAAAPAGAKVNAAGKIVADDVEFADKPQSFGRQAWVRFRSHKLAIIGAFMLVFLILSFFLGGYLVDYEYDAINIPDRSQGPSRAHWFGTDDLGRDLFVRSMRGGQYSITISVITGLASAVLGGLIGSVAGYFGGLADSSVTFIINVLMTLNALAVLLVLGAKFKVTAVTMAVLLSLMIWVRGARVVRALVMQYKERDFVLAAKAAGAGPARIIFRHLMPNVVGALLVEATLLAGSAIILESTLSFLALGIQPPETTLGTLIADSKGVIDTNPSRVLIPGFIVTLIVLAVNFLGDGLRDALDPTHIES